MDRPMEGRLAMIAGIGRRISANRRGEPENKVLGTLPPFATNMQKPVAVPAAASPTDRRL